MTDKSLEHFLQAAMRPIDNPAPKFVIEIVAEPIFNLDVDSELITDLGNIACGHYDAHCKSFAQQGGMLWGWRNRIWWWEDETYARTRPLPAHVEAMEEPIQLPVPRPQVQATWDQLDTLLKICEMRFYTLDIKNMAKLEAFIRSVRIAMGTWRVVQKNWVKVL